MIDLPEKLRRVTHHRRHSLDCPLCQARTTAAPAPEAANCFGPGIQAATAYFSGVGRLSKRTIALLFADLYDIPLALGCVSKLEARASLALHSIHEEALDHTQSRDANVDETGWKQGKKKAWLWAAVTRLVTVFLIRRHRNRGAFAELVGPTPGVLTTDRYSVYAHLPGERRQICWAHLRRDFQAMIDRRDRGSGIGEELLLHADILAQEWEKVRSGTRTRAWFQREILPWLREEVHLLLESGSRCGGSNTAGVCGELLSLEASLWTFASRPGVEPTNSAAERAVRHADCWRKTSYSIDSERGSRFVERILTVVASCRSQGRDVMEFLTQAITAHQNGAQKPSILGDGGVNAYRHSPSATANLSMATVEPITKAPGRAPSFAHPPEGHDATLPPGPFFANTGPTDGPIRGEDRCPVTGVYNAPDCGRRAGIAYPRGVVVSMKGMVRREAREAGQIRVRALEFVTHSIRADELVSSASHACHVVSSHLDVEILCPCEDGDTEYLRQLFNEVFVRTALAGLES